MEGKGRRGKGKGRVGRGKKERVAPQLGSLYPPVLGIRTPSICTTSISLSHADLRYCTTNLSQCVAWRACLPCSFSPDVKGNEIRV